MRVVENKLRSLLDNEGVTQAEMHRVSGINLITINQICAGKNKSPRPTTIAKLVKALNKISGKEYNFDDVFFKV